LSGLNGYLISVSAAALLVSLVSSLITNAKIKQVALYTGNLILLLAILSPLVTIDQNRIMDAVRDLQREIEAGPTEPTFGNDETMERLIIEQCRAYILDKAAELGADVDVTIFVAETDGIPYPSSASVAGTYSPYAREKLSDILEEDLGIPLWKQEWSEP